MIIIIIWSTRRRRRNNYINSTNRNLFDIKLKCSLRKYLSNLEQNIRKQSSALTFTSLVEGFFTDEDILKQFLEKKEHIFCTEWILIAEWILLDQ